MKVLLMMADKGYERLSYATTSQVAGEVVDYIPRSVITALAHALILPPQNFGFEAKSSSTPSEGRTTGAVQKPTGWLVRGQLVFERDVTMARQQLSSIDRWEIDHWVGSAKKRLMVGDTAFQDYVESRSLEMTPDEIRDAVLRDGGYRVSWRTSPLFRRQLVTRAGLAFWRLALLLRVGS